MARCRGNAVCALNMSYNSGALRLAKSLVLRLLCEGEEKDE